MCTSLHYEGNHDTGKLRKFVMALQPRLKKENEDDNRKVKTLPQILIDIIVSAANNNRKNAR